MILRRSIFPLLSLALILGACESPGASLPDDVVARVNGVDFTAETVAEILTPQTRLPSQPAVVEALANLWVDYYLLAHLITEDSTLANLDVSPLVQENTNQQMVFNLRDKVIQVDTSFTDEELRAMYERELPGARVRARHILFRIPEGASQAQEDSVRALAQSVRDRILAGENFAVLAGEYSQDPGTASEGGDLGFFTRGQMVPQFEEVAFNLDEGEVSEVVRTPFGLHLIRSDEIDIPPVEENLTRFRQQMKNRRIEEAESTYVAGVMDEADPEVLSDAFETVRQLAENPTLPLTARAERRPLIRFNGGEITVADFREWVMFRPPPMRNEFQRASDEQMEGMLLDFARERLLIRQAGLEGIEVSEAGRDSLALSIREGVKTVARQLGFLQLAENARGAGSEAMEGVLEQSVVGFMKDIVSQRERVISLGGISLALRRQFEARINPAGTQRALDLIDSLRAQPPAPPSSMENPDSADSGDLGSGGSGGS